MKIKSLSASRIKTYKDCAFKYYLQYHRACKFLKSFPTEQGSLVHVVYEEHAKALKNGEKPKDYKKIILDGYRGRDGIWNIPLRSKKQNSMFSGEKHCDSCPFLKNDRCQINNLKPYDKKGNELFEGCPRRMYEDAVKLSEIVLDDPTTTNPMNHKIVDVENRFEIEVEDGVKVVGLMDIVTEFDDETIQVFDYKSGNSQMTYEECLTDPQLLIYNYAAQIEYPQYQNYWITIYYLRKKPITLVYNQKDYEGTELALKHYYHAIKDDTNPTRRCDRRDGSVNYDWVCKYMCDIDICEAEFDLFRENDYKILPSVERERK